MLENGRYTGAVVVVVHFSLSVLTAIFQVNPEDDGGGGDNWTTGAISRAKLQSDRHYQQTNIQFFLQAGCPSCRPTNSVKALKGKISHSMDLLTPSSSGGPDQARCTKGLSKKDL